jgi:branched-chain amino acid transport system substrate-binding protein
MTIRRSIAIGLAALATAFAAGCGDDDDEPASGGATAPAASEPDTSNKATGTPIKIGSICSCTGPLAASLGRSLDVLEVWVEHTNNTGGINGHPVELVTVDDGQNPAKGLAGAKKLIEDDEVVAIVGQMSLVSASWEKYVSDAGVPVVGGQTVDTPFLTNPGFFTSGTTLPILLFSELALAKEAGATKVGAFYCAETPICEQLLPIFKGLGGQLGLEIEGSKISTTAPNYTAPCLAFKQKGVDALIVSVNSDVVPRVIDSCAQQGFTAQNVASSATTQKSWLTNDNLDGTLIVGTNANYTDQSIPGVKTFTDALSQYAPDILDSPQFSWPLLFPWAGGELFKAAGEAAKLTPTSTTDDVKKGLYALENETLDGLAPPLQFEEGKPGFPVCYFPAKIEGGEFVTTGDGSPTCLDAETAGAIAQALAPPG